MQPSSLPSEMAAPPTARGPWPALVPLALLALLFAAQPADAAATSTSNPLLRTGFVETEGVHMRGIELYYGYDPQSGQAQFTACIEHDPYRWPGDAGFDEDGDAAVWLPSGLKSGDGTDKASTSCITAPPEGPATPIRVGAGS